MPLWKINFCNSKRQRWYHQIHGMFLCTATAPRIIWESPNSQSRKYEIIIFKEQLLHHIAFILFQLTLKATKTNAYTFKASSSPPWYVFRHHTNTFCSKQIMWTSYWSTEAIHLLNNQNPLPCGHLASSYYKQNTSHTVKTVELFPIAKTSAKPTNKLYLLMM